ncbi:MAG: hypothetical protein IKZ58_07065, partial [Selenomonadaceae bacterium]|nr:hypothetical protein [Selenomonadaceae bacterium]
LLSNADSNTAIKIPSGINSVVTSTIKNGKVEGTDNAEYIVIKHHNNSVYAYNGNDTIAVYSNNNKIAGGAGNDFIVMQSWAENNKLDNSDYWSNTDSRRHYGLDGNDTIINAGNKSYLVDSVGSNYFVSGGTGNTIQGNANGVDDFFIYSYGDTANVNIISSENTEDNFTISTGYVGVEGTDFLDAEYNGSTNETINVTITDFDSIDALTVINSGMTALNHSINSNGTYLYDNTGQVNIFLSGITNWDSVKRTTLKYGTGNGSLSTTTLDKATLLSNADSNTAIKIPSGINSVVTSTIKNGKVEGTDNAEYIVTKHHNNSVYAYNGNDTIAVYSSNNKIAGGAGNDFIVMQSWAENNKLDNSDYWSNTDSRRHYGLDGNDTIINAGNNSNLVDSVGSNYFVSGGTNNTIQGNANGVDDFFIYSYGDTANVKIISSENTEDNFTISTGYVGVEGTDFLDAEYNGSTKETINTTITGFDSLDALTVVNSGMTALNHSVNSNGTYLYDNTGQVNIFLSGVTNWNSVKRTVLNYSNGGELSTTTLDKATVLTGTSSSVPSDTTPSGLIKGTRNADNITNTLSGVTIDAGAGNDTVTNRGSNVSVFGGADNDSLNNYGTKSTIEGGDGNDTIMSGGGQSTILGGDGADSVSNVANSVYISGGSGNDYLWNSSLGSSVTMYGGAGKDTVYNAGSNVTIDGNADDDLISLSGSGNLVKHTAGEGDDTIYGMNGNSLQISGSDYVTIANGSDIIVSLESGSVRLKNIQGKSFKLNGTSVSGGEDTTPADTTPADTTPADTTPADTTPSNLINGTKNADNITNTLSGVTIDAGAGNDTIKNSGDNVSISGGAGADKISLSSSAQNVTINGGAGVDTIYTNGKGNLIQYGSGDGNDVIVGFGGDDSLVLTSGNLTSTAVSGSNLILTVGSSKVTLQNVSAKNINTGGGALTFTDEIEEEDTIPADLINGTAKTDNISNSKSNVTISALAGNDTIKNSGDDVSISGGAGNDKISLSSSAQNVTINGGAGADTIWTNGTGNLIQYKTGDGKDVIVGFGESDSIQLTSGSISKSVQSGSNVLVTVGSGTSNVITIKNVSINNLSLEDKVITYTDEPDGGYPMSLTSGADKQAFTDDNATVYAVGGKDTITISGSTSYLSGGADADRLISSGNENTVMGDAGNDTIFASGNDGLIDGGTGTDKISLDSSAQNFTIKGGTGNDTIYTNGTGNLIQYASKDGKDVIVGFGESDSIQLTSGSVSKSVQSGDNVLITIGSGTSNVITIKDVKLKDLSLDDKIITVADSLAKTLSAGNDTYSNTLESAMIYASAGKDTITNSAHYVYIDGGKGNDSIVNTGNVVSIDGGEGTDKISLGSEAGSVTITGGEGNDTIWTNGEGNLIQYGSKDGKDVIVGFKGDDSIQITSGTISKWFQSGSNVLVTVGSGTSNVITIKDVKIGDLSIDDKVITISSLMPTSLSPSADKHTNALDNATIYALAGNDKITNTGDEVTIFGGADNDTIISNGDGALLNGGTGDDRISLGTNADHVTIVGGKGNDSILGNDNPVLYQYTNGDGNDTISGFSKGDSIQVLSGSISSVKSGTTVTFKVGSGKIVLRNVGDEKFQIENKVITIKEDSSRIDGTEKADTFDNQNDGAVIFAMGGNDTVTNSGNSVYVNGGTDNDKLTNTGNEVTLLGDAGNDTLISNGNTALLNGGAGTDKISLGADAEQVTVIGGKDNDTIYGNDNPVFYQYSNGDGKDTILGFSKGDSIQVLSGSISSVKSGTNVTFKVGSGHIFLRDVGDEKFKIEDNVITIKDGSKRIDGSEYADTLENENTGAIIYAYGGSDKITNSGNSTTIIGGEGSDKITNTGDEVLISGGAGKDTVSLGSSAVEVTINGGVGDDKIYTNGNGNLIQYASGDGKDTIFGFGGDDSIQITGTIGKYKQSGADVSVTIGSGTSNVITIKDTKLDNLSFEDGVITSNSSTSELIAEDYWFAENNLVDDGMNLNAVTSNNYSIGDNVIATNFDNLNQNDSLSTVFVSSN